MNAICLGVCFATITKQWYFFGMLFALAVWFLLTFFSGRHCWTLVSEDLRSKKLINPTKIEEEAERERQKTLQAKITNAYLCFGFCVFVFVLLSFGAVGFAPLVFMEKGTDYGPNEFGDTFGFVNALFSGFAFVGIIVAIGLQSVELKYQRNELKQSVEAQKSNSQQLFYSAYLSSLSALLEHSPNTPRYRERNTKALLSIDKLMEDLREDKEMSKLVPKLNDGKLEDSLRNDWLDTLKYEVLEPLRRALAVCNPDEQLRTEKMIELWSQLAKAVSEVRASLGRLTAQLLVTNADTRGELKNIHSELDLYEMTREGEFTSYHESIWHIKDDISKLHRKMKDAPEHYFSGD